MPRPYNPKVRCKANHGTCKRAAIRGGVVCYTHGGAIQRVKRKATERVAEVTANLVDPDRVLREAARLAYSDIRELYDEQGKLKPMRQWPDHLAAAVASVEMVRRNVDSGDGQTDDVIKLKLWDKPKNLELLFRHLGLLKDKLELGGEITLGWKGSGGDKA